MVERPKVRLQDGLQRPQGHLQLRLRRVDGRLPPFRLGTVRGRKGSIGPPRRAERTGRELLQAVNGRRNIEFLIPGIGHDLAYQVLVAPWSIRSRHGLAGLANGSASPKRISSMVTWWYRGDCLPSYTAWWFLLSHGRRDVLRWSYPGFNWIWSLSS